MVNRRAWSRIEVSFFIVYTVWFALGIGIFSTRPIPEQVKLQLWQVDAFLVVCYLIPLLFWRPGYVHGTLFPLAVLLTSGTLEVYVSYYTHSQVLLLMLPLLIIGFLADRYNIWWTFPVFVIGIPVVIVFFSDYVYPIATLLNEAGLNLLFFSLGFSAQRLHSSQRRMRLLLEENMRQYTLIREQNKVLEQYAAQIEQVTLLEERNRVARELHDTVGHTFTSTIMGMDAVAYLLESAPDKAREKLEVLRELTRKGLDEVRRSIHQIAPDASDESLAQQLTRLADEFAAHTGTSVRLQVDGEESELSVAARLTLVRCLQESLTNAKRHGQATAIEARLSFAPERVELTVADDGTGTEGLAKGFGLTAMTDRLQALQGSLHVESQPGRGTLVRCSLPVQR